MVSDLQESGLFLRVLVINEIVEPRFSAIALDMDTWGSGRTAEDACRDLSGNLKILISFALQLERIALIENSAPDEFLDRYYARRYSRMPNGLTNDKATSIPYPNVDFDSFQPCDKESLIQRMSELDDRLCLYQHHQNSRDKILYHPDVRGRPVAYPLRSNVETDRLDSVHLPIIARRFSLAVDDLQFLTGELG